MSLQKESYYADTYDLWTIQECLRVIEFWKSKEKDSEAKESLVRFGSDFQLYTIKGERYKERAEFIRDWMRKDKERDERVENAREPQNVRCPNCYERMKFELKDLYDFPDEPSGVLFFFECPSCKKRKGIFDNGQEYVSKPHYCSRCKKVVEVSHKKDGNVITTIRNCSACGFIETEIDDYDKMDAERQERKRQERELLEKHRAEFCLSPKEGEEYIEAVRRMDALKELLLRIEQKQTDPDYQKVEKLKKLKILDLEKLLSEILDKEKYIKLSFEKPSIDKHIIVPFSIQDADSARDEKNSVYKLQRLIKKSLEGTNWRLMSEGISCRLGYLSGRLKGYEQEDDLVRMVKSDDKL